MKINKKGRALRMQGGLYAWIEHNTLVHTVIQRVERYSLINLFC
jgi:hypothetical protein